MPPCLDRVTIFLAILILLWLSALSFPLIFSEIAKNGSDSQKKWAEDSLTLSDKIRQDRLAFIPPHQQPNPLILKEEPVAPWRKNRRIYSAGNTTNLPGQEIRKEGDSSVSDDAVNQAYDGTGATFDLFSNSYQRNSIDGKGLNLLSTVHYSVKYDNAFWDGQQMVYGNGDGELFGLFTKPIDVTGHELTHGVTQYSANLTYEGQSGALNESFSDCFGSMVKQQVLGQTAEKADWLIGEGIFTPRVNGTALRSMKAPGTAYDDPVLGKDPQPADMAHFVTTSDDNGGVHVNSGIPNHAFYLSAVGIGGSSWEGAGKIWYKTLTEKLQSNANFAECAHATITAAAELFGDGKEKSAVETAWKTVGVL